MEDQQYYSFSRYARADGEGRVKIDLTVYFNESKTDFSEMICKSAEELEQMKEVSKAEESAARRALETTVGNDWAEKAAHTMMIKKALEYVRTQPAKHTGNKWTESAERKGFFEISNMVYIMTYHVNENTRYSHKQGKQISVAWDVTWDVRFNAPRGYYNRTSLSADIAGQRDKRYTDKAAADKYLQGRINAYAHLFTEISPPIPEEKAKLFCVNGILLPGYTIATHEPTPDELLDFLDDGDFPGEHAVERAEEKPAPSQGRKKASAPKRGHSR